MISTSFLSTTGRRIGVLAFALLLSACAHVSKVATGDTVLKNRLVVKVDTAWNQFDRGTDDDTPTWTVEGITVDALKFYVGVKEGEAIAPPAPGQKGGVPLTFHAGMQPGDVVGLYQSLLTRDGSSFTLDKLEPAEFVGAKGFRFEYSVVRKTDDVRLRGVGYGAIRNGELFAITYSAPRLGFFAKHATQAEVLAKSARVRA